MTTAEELSERYPEVLYPGDLKDVPPGWLDIVDRYFAVVSPLMKDSGYEVVTAAELAGGLDWMWTSPLSAMTAERHRVVDREDVLLELRSYHTCSTCGRPGVGWTTGKTIVTRCEEHSGGERVVDGKPLMRRTPHGVVRYDVAADQLVDVDAEDV
ncbi:hypothetical protein [Rhizobium leguminosarum]|uniref:hypothetical protein n=1 Tax=Rhizobium leguminosarum TaxID=384 RepID=UPI001C969B64|nr:hypothetical protein [Rhizobium leguminosarum]MBY5329551.1 hypothetical protein [Rhizobium leguminosarum]